MVVLRLERDPSGHAPRSLSRPPRVVHLGTTARPPARVSAEPSSSRAEPWEASDAKDDVRHRPEARGGRTGSRGRRRRPSRAPHANLEYAANLGSFWADIPLWNAVESALACLGLQWEGRWASEHAGSLCPSRRAGSVHQPGRAANPEELPQHFDSLLLLPNPQWI